jgi:outer membrane protein assembly factor BamA
LLFTITYADHPLRSKLIPMPSLLFRITFLSIIGVLTLYSQSNAIELDSLSLGDNESIRIDSLVISGNKTTKDFIILRELSFSVGDTVTGKILRYNRERIFSLGLFTSVEFHFEKYDGQNVLEIKVAEGWYIYPIPVFFSKNGDIDKSTYGLSLLYRNFRGRNETIKTSFGLGYSPFYSILYETPALDYENEIGLQFYFSYWRTTNQSETARAIIGHDYENKIFYNSITLSKRFDQRNLLTGTIGFDYVEVPTVIEGFTASGEKVDRTPCIGLGYYYDSRDLKQFSRDGLYTFIHFAHKGFGLGNISYNKFEIDYREYRKIVGELAAKWRLYWTTSFGRVIPYYDYSVLGYYEKVRGHSGDISEGKGSLLTLIELSYPIIKDWNIQFKLPLIPESLTSYRIDIYFTSFYDAGETYNKTTQVAFNNFYSGYGFGLTFLILPYNAVRFEYARNELGKGEFSFGLGFSF